MPTLTITKTYNDGSVLNESDLDNIKSSIETFINSTKLDGDNIQIENIANDVFDAITWNSTRADAAVAEVSSTGANAIASAMDDTGANAIFDTVTWNSTRADAVATNVSSTGANAIIDSYTRSTGTSVGKRGVAISNSSGNFHSTSNSEVSVTNLSVTITTSGRPVMIMLVGTNLHSTIQSRDGIWYIYRGSTKIIETQLVAFDSVGSGNFITLPPGCLNIIDTPPSGTHTYSLKVIPGGAGVRVNNCRLVAFEL